MPKKEIRKETVEEFLARGGQIQRIETGLSGENLRVRGSTSHGVPRFEDPITRKFNKGRFNGAEVEVPEKQSAPAE